MMQLALNMNDSDSKKWNLKLCEIDIGQISSFPRSLFKLYDFKEMSTKELDEYALGT